MWHKINTASDARYRGITSSRTLDGCAASTGSRALGERERGKLPDRRAAFPGAWRQICAYRSLSSSSPDAASQVDARLKASLPKNTLASWAL